MVRKWCIFLISAATAANLYAGDKSDNVKRFLNSWCSAHNKWSLNRIRIMYADEVLYYCDRVTNEELINDKAQYFRPNDAYFMEIVSEPVLSEFSGSILRCDFEKEVYYKGVKNRYQAYMLIDMAKLDPEIVCESDLLTDSRREFVVETSVFERSASDAYENEHEFGQWLALTGGLTLACGGYILWRRSRQKRNSPERSD